MRISPPNSRKMCLSGSAGSLVVTFLFLAFVSILPFSTSLLGHYLKDPLAIRLHYLNQFAIALALTAQLHFASRTTPAGRTVMAHDVLAPDRDDRRLCGGNFIHMVRGWALRFGFPVVLTALVGRVVRKKMLRTSVE